MPGTPDEEEPGVAPTATQSAPATLGDLQTQWHMTGLAWFIAAMLFVAVASFFVVVVLLGVDNS
ncbi:MAG: hypothetical protein ACREOA_01055 [Candidatus Dormibacteria bacterium]